MRRTIIFFAIIAILLSSCQQAAEQSVTEEDVQGIIVTQEELSTHNTSNDCWVAYQGTVYDVTQFLDRHPGGAGAIIPYCGTSEEFETAFGNQHGQRQVETLKREGIPKGELE